MRVLFYNEDDDIMLYESPFVYEDFDGLHIEPPNDYYPSFILSGEGLEAVKSRQGHMFLEKALKEGFLDLREDGFRCVEVE